MKRTRKCQRYGESFVKWIPWVVVMTTVTPFICSHNPSNGPFPPWSFSILSSLTVLRSVLVSRSEPLCHRADPSPMGCL
jgi:hypothetical protein